MGNISDFEVSAMKSPNIPNIYRYFQANQFFPSDHGESYSIGS